MKKRADKIKDAETLRKALSESQHLFLASFEKMTVDQDFKLRKVIRAAGAGYRVIKNNLAQKASEGLDSKALFEGLAGMTSMVYTSSDPVAVAKALTAYAKTNPSFSFKAGMVEGRVINVKDIQELSSMPSKDELYAKILWLINSPAQRLVTAVNGVGRNLAVVIDQGVKENKFQS